MTKRKFTHAWFVQYGTRSAKTVWQTVFKSLPRFHARLTLKASSCWFQMHNLRENGYRVVKPWPFEHIRWYTHRSATKESSWGQSLQRPHSHRQYNFCGNMIDFCKTSKLKLREKCHHNNTQLYRCQRTNSCSSEHLSGFISWAENFGAGSSMATEPSWRALNFCTNLRTVRL